MGTPGACLTSAAYQVQQFLNGLQQPSKLAERRATEISEFDIDAYQYSHEEVNSESRPPLNRAPWSSESRDSLQLPALKSASASISSHDSQPTTPEDGRPDSHVMRPHQPIVAAFERRKDGGVEPKPTLTLNGASMLPTISKDRVKAPRSGQAVPASPKATHAAAPSTAAVQASPATQRDGSSSSRVSMQSISRSLRQSLSFSRHPSVVSVPDSPAASAKRRKRSTEKNVSTGESGGPSVSPSMAAKEAAHAVIANRVRSRIDEPPARRATSCESHTAPPVPVLLGTSSKVATPANAAQFATSPPPVRDPSPLRRPKTAPNPEISKLLPPLPLKPNLRDIPPARPTIQAVSHLSSSDFINPWATAAAHGSSATTSSAPVAHSPGGGTVQLPSLETPGSLSPMPNAGACSSISSPLPLSPLSPVQKASPQSADHLSISPTTPSPLESCARPAEGAQCESARGAVTEYLAPLRPRRSSSWRLRDDTYRQRRLSSVEATTAAAILRSRRASSIASRKEFMRRETLASTEIVWPSILRNNSLGSHGFPSTPSDDDCLVFSGKTDEVGRREYFILRDPWTGTNLPASVTPPLISGPGDELSRGRRASSLPSNTLITAESAAQAIGTPGQAFTPSMGARGLRVSIDVGHMAASLRNR